MRAGNPVRPVLVVNRRFMQAFLAADPPCMALGMVEVQQQLGGMLALRLDEAIPAAIAARGFEFGHALFGTTTFAVLHLVFAFPGFQTYNVLINPHNLVAQAVLRTMLDDGDYSFFALQPQGQVTAFRAEIGSDALAVLRANRARLQASTTTDAHYQQALTSFAARPDPAGVLLRWVCRETVVALDLTTDRMTLTPA
jgi:hypothetical protein